MVELSRRQFVAAAVGQVRAGGAQSASSRFRKGICRVSFPPKAPLAECFRLARNAGFEGVEVPMTGELEPEAAPDQVKAIGDQARRAGVEIVALWVTPLGANPLNSPNPEERARGLEAIRTAVRFAGYLNCEALLMVPGRVGSGAKFYQGYEITWERISAELKKVIPFAAERRVMLTVENVSNRFLVSPLEARAFVDQFRSPWLQFFFDTGNIVPFGYPQDWILTLGQRIRRVHAKNRSVAPRGPEARSGGLLEGDVDWKAVMAALVQVGYRGFLSPEYGYDPEQADQLQKLSADLDTILAMA